MQSKQNIVSIARRIWHMMFPKRATIERTHTMSTKEKKVNYTPEQTKEIVAGYVANPTKETVAMFATKFGKTSRSIVAKLSREGVYKKAEYVAKNGEKPETKEVKVEKIAKMIGTTADKLGGLEAATKGALDLIFDALSEAMGAVEAIDAEAGEQGNAETA